MLDITARPRLLSVTESIALPPQPSRWSDARYRKIRHSRVAGAAGAAADLSWPADRRRGGTSALERFPAKHALGLDPGVDAGWREENASKQKSRSPFRFNRNGKGSGPYQLTCGNELRARRTGNQMANTATIRNANGLPATFVGSKTGRDDAPFVFIKVGDEERRMRWAEWDALPAWTGPRPSRAGRE